MRQTVDFEGAVSPLDDPLDRLARGYEPWVSTDGGAFFRDVRDHLLLVESKAARLRALVGSALDANLAQVSVQQNEDMRRISAWVAIAALPTMIAGIYGMNFEHMPELGWRYGYLIVLGFIAVACLLLYRTFRRSGWL